MKEHPILMSAVMIPALLAGEKTQTRRVITTPIDEWAARRWPPPEGDTILLRVRADGTSLRLHCPYGIPGERLWVKESLRGDGQPGNRRVGIARYAVDGNMVLEKIEDAGRADVLWEWKRPVLPARFMPRWASRITLEITDVRVQRVQEISNEDALAEGVIEENGDYHWPGRNTFRRNARIAFSEGWDDINAKRRLGFDVNPWVWALTFRRIDANARPK
ncbi:MAG: hypothetical protein V1929_02755 [bacterium]